MSAMRGASSLRWLPAGIFSVSSISLFVAAGCGHASKPVALPPVPGTQPAGGFAGNQACAECHVKEFRAHAANGHALTLRIPDRASLGAQFPMAGPIPKTKYAVKEERGRLALATNGSAAKPLDLAFGSGASGISFAVMEGPDSFYRTRMSYFPSTRTWIVSPGLERVEERSSATRVKGQGARGCILCHAVTLPADSVQPEARFLGVGCESCHGPGADHIAAARTAPAQRAGGPKELRMADMKVWPAMQVNQACGACHAATEKDAHTLKETGLLKFQVDSIARSRCYVQSLGAVSCVNCHDPHGALSTDPRTYESACLKCHGAAVKPAAGDDDPARGRPCPVNPKNGCIPCHMPARRIFPGTSIMTKMTDHRIRARPN